MGEDVQHKVMVGRGAMLAVAAERAPADAVEFRLAKSRTVAQVDSDEISRRRRRRNGFVGRLCGMHDFVKASQGVVGWCWLMGGGARKAGSLLLAPGKSSPASRGAGSWKKSGDHAGVGEGSGLGMAAAAAAASLFLRRTVCERARPALS